MVVGILGNGQLCGMLLLASVNDERLRQYRYRVLGENGTGLTNKWADESVIGSLKDAQVVREFVVTV